MNKTSQKKQKKEQTNIKLPFVMSNKKIVFNQNSKNNSKNKTLKILNNKQMHGGFINFLKEYLFPTKKISDSNKLIYIKGSSTKEYYNKINNNNK
jgi:hypothetical protein